jgi:hypothetical protein
MCEVTCGPMSVFCLVAGKMNVIIKGLVGS